VPDKVLQSIHNQEADRCVDIFVRDDGSFGFEEYRRDHEDGGRWYPLQRYSRQVFDSAEHAVARARSAVAWLGETD
jgi:hypothetical protein